MANDRLDIVVFGATGFTGKYAVKATARFCKEHNLKFGIAGRRKEVLETIIKKLDTDIGKICSSFLHFNLIYLTFGELFYISLMDTFTLHV